MNRDETISQLKTNVSKIDEYQSEISRLHVEVDRRTTRMGELYSAVETLRKENEAIVRRMQGAET